MPRKRKPSLKEAKARTLRVYRLALKKAEKGNWEGAAALTEVGMEDCSFCQHFGASYFNDCPKSKCPVWKMCSLNPWGRGADFNAISVLIHSRTPANGLRHFRRTIEQLKALEI